jgi:WD40 repeat protein
VEIRGLALHPAQGWVACATDGAKLHFLSGDTLQPDRPPLTSGGAPIQITADGASLAWCAFNAIHLLNLRTGAELRQLLPPEGDGHEDGSIDSLALSPRGTLLASSAGGTKHVQLWELWSGRRLADLYAGGGTVNVAFSPDGRSLAVTADERTQLYEIRGQHE